MALIYAIVPRKRGTGTCYVGCTARALAQRAREHVAASRRFPRRAVYRFVARQGGWGRVRFTVLETMPGASRRAMLDRESFYIARMGTLNS